MKSLMSSLALFSTITVGAFVGLGVRENDPACAYACYNSISSAPLGCSGTGRGGSHSHGAPPTSPTCRAGDVPFLTTLAYCISLKCKEIPGLNLEQYWASHATGSPDVLPKWTYAETLREVSIPPNSTYTRGSILDSTVLVDPTTYSIQVNFMVVFENVGVLQNVYT